MKTLYIFILFIFISVSSNADLTGSKHDLSVLGGEPCAYCHSVHNGVGGLGRPSYMSDTLPSISDIYNSNTLDVADSATIATVSNSDAPLCLTCHDGAWVQSMVTGGSVEFSNIQNLMYPAGNQRLNIGSDLSNDHPIAFVYPNDINTYDDELKYPTAGSKVYVTFGPGRNEMWCCTCHDPHGGSADPLLVMSNSGSALCLECHIK